ncbi:hypothetical protein F4779DRAFT_619185 [Xylariaceae sp. FL0662B]|nr:hypothetical protein F4779DRAFT_619185 [Xylariaceae sp. FL0662B]
MAASVEDLAAKGVTILGLYAWLRHQLFVAFLGAVYEPKNPLIKPKTESAWGVFEKGTFILMADQEASSFSQGILNHSAQHGLGHSDLARGEPGDIAGIATSTMRPVFWLFYPVVSDPSLLGLCRSEVAQPTRSDSNPEEIDLAHISTDRPVPLAAWHEV